MQTVVAISTPAGRGAIGIVRVTGTEAIAIADKVFRGISKKPLSSLKGYTASYGEIVDHENVAIDEGVATVFRGPKSYTGEDMVEITCHGNPLIASQVLKALVQSGAEPAGAGEFTKRAFLNGKLDLTEAEGVAELIAAKGEAAIRLAKRKRHGALSKRIEELSTGLTYLAAQLAVWLDYPDDIVMEMTHEEMLPIAKTAEKELEILADSYAKTQKVTQGVTIAIVGRPNAGKSTLMNLLSGEDKSIVTHHAGTTRDVVENTIELENVTLRLLDTAGLRETLDPVEAIGVERAYRELEKADIALLMIDGSQPLIEEDRNLVKALSSRKAVVVLNKEDLGLAEENIAEIRSLLPNSNLWTETQHPELPILTLQGITGQGMEQVRLALSHIAGVDNGDDLLITNQREQMLIAKAKEAVSVLCMLIESGMTYDILTVAVDDVLSPLWEIVGKSASKEIINSIFDQFCVGK